MEDANEKMGKKMETAEEMTGMMSFYEQVQQQGGEMSALVTEI